MTLDELDGKSEIAAAFSDTRARAVVYAGGVAKAHR